MKSKTEYFLRNINLLNILLLAVIVAWVYFGIMPLLRTDIEYVPFAAKETIKDSEDQLTRKEYPSLMEYLIIAERNPFHPEKIVPAPAKKVAVPKSKPLSKPDIVLYGTIITDEMSFAHLEDKKSPISSTGRGKRLRVMKTGEKIGDFLLKEILTDKIILFRGSEKMTVNLFYPPKERTYVVQKTPVTSETETKR